MEEVFQAYIVLKLFNAIGPNQEYSTDNVATINGTKSNFKEKISVMGANCQCLCRSTVDTTVIISFQIPGSSRSQKN